MRILPFETCAMKELSSSWDNGVTMPLMIIAPLSPRASTPNGHILDTPIERSFRNSTHSYFVLFFTLSLSISFCVCCSFAFSHLCPHAFGRSPFAPFVSSTPIAVPYVVLYALLCGTRIYIHSTVTFSVRCSFAFSRISFFPPLPPAAFGHYPYSPILPIPIPYPPQPTPPH